MAPFRPGCACASAENLEFEEEEFDLDQPLMPRQGTPVGQSRQRARERPVVSGRQRVRGRAIAKARFSQVRTDRSCRRPVRGNHQRFPDNIEAAKSWAKSTKRRGWRTKRRAIPHARQILRMKGEMAGAQAMEEEAERLKPKTAPALVRRRPRRRWCGRHRGLAPPGRRSAHCHKSPKKRSPSTRRRAASRVSRSF